MPKRETVRKPAEAMIRIGTVMGIPIVLQQLGLNPEKVLVEAGFDPIIFADPEHLISFTARSKLLGFCAAKAKCEHFGLLVGEQGGLHSFGLIGLLMRYSPDVGTALKNLVRHFHLHAHGTSTSLHVNDKVAILGFHIHHGSTSEHKQISEGALALMLNILQELCLPGWKPGEVWFMHAEPANIQPYRDFFKVRLRFNSEQNAIVFHSSCLTVNLPEVHANIRQLVQRQIDALAAKHSEDFPEQVRSVLRASLLHGDYSAANIGALFSMHPKTLNRRLATYGLHYQELLDEIRFKMARQLLKDSTLEIKQIAHILHYTDHRPFARAFRRWSGDTPAQWRATALADSPT